MMLSNVFVFYQVMYVSTYCSELFINIKTFEKRDSRSREQVLKQKHWELSLEVKGSEYTSVFLLIFQFIPKVQ